MDQPAERHPRTRTDPAVDALTVAPDASYRAQARRPRVDATEIAVVDRMLGRPARGRPAAAVRCGWGLPAVLRVDPALEDGTPFPTTFWLACPLGVRRVATLEADGTMEGLSARLADDAELADAYRAAHRRYVDFRNGLGPPVPGDPSAGGMPDRVKCLHAAYAHHLATADNPIGAWVAEQLEPLACPAPCVVAEGSPLRPHGSSPAGP